MAATARRAACAALTVCAALTLSACNPSGSGATASSAATQSSPNLSAPPSSPTASVKAGSSSGASASSAVSSPACTDLVVTTAVKTEVTRTYAAHSKLVHIQPAPGSFLYGQCGGVTYAASRFEPTTGATEEEQVASQDEGSVRKYFKLNLSGSWTYLGSAGFPATDGCIRRIPHALAMIWADCQSP
ncbi:hypothetical protein [Streptacidiphilus carbonis]|uniref:hypothetical protein n=1 Tax=Streptacidiphilus carbonis TaxID=105422 RepID=UPI0005A7CCFA|nr:hypothetical protein [Streptacidiphilus carbonis]